MFTVGNLKLEIRQFSTSSADSLKSLQNPRGLQFKRMNFTIRKLCFKKEMKKENISAELFYFVCF